MVYDTLNCSLMPDYKLMIITGFTPINTQNCILSDARIDLWQFTLDQPFQVASQLLDEEETIRGDQFYFSHHKRRFVTARATLRVILAKYLNTSPERLEFNYNPQGKPSVVNNQKLQFNMSHSGELAIIAIGKGSPLGVDIEKYSSRPYLGIAKKLFAPQEFHALNKAPAALKTALFFHIWSQKEAFIKANGLGLSYPTQEFNVPTTIPTKQLVDDPLHNMTWQLRSFMPKVGYSGALCYHPTIREIRHGMLSLPQTTHLTF